MTRFPADDFTPCSGDDALKLAYAAESSARDALNEVRPTRKGRKPTAEPCVYEGKRFDTRDEVRRYVELRRQLSAGQIGSLIRQHELPVVINGVRICSYVVDFYYVRDGREHYEDVRAGREPLYRIKRRLVSATLGIEIEDIQ